MCFSVKLYHHYENNDPFNVNQWKLQKISAAKIRLKLLKELKSSMMNCKNSVADPNPADPYVFGLPGSGSISQRYGSFYHQAKIVRKTLIPTAL